MKWYELWVLYETIDVAIVVLILGYLTYKRFRNLKKLGYHLSAGWVK